MEKKFQVVTEGTQVQVGDLNTLGEVSGLADDRVFAELMRMTPYNGTTATKAILPFAEANSADTYFIGPNGASGSVKVNPFRAFVSSRTALASSTLANWRDIRSTVVVGASTLHTSVALGANASGNPRWDLVYAAITPDADSPTETRKVKNTTTKVISDQSVVTTKVTTVTLGVTAGTAAASPTFPATPADASGTYYIPLAYVRVPNGFGAASSVPYTDIVTVAPTNLLSRATGASSVQPANQSAVLTTAQQQAWGSTGNDPTAYVPSTATGMETVFALIDLTTGAVSHASGDTLDDRVWANRLAFGYMAISTATGDYPWDSGSDANVFPSAVTANSGIGKVVTCMGQTYTNAHFTLLGGDKCPLLYVNDTLDAELDPGRYVLIYVDTNDYKLKVEYGGGAVNRRLLVVIQFFSPMPRA